MRGKGDVIYYSFIYIYIKPAPDNTKRIHYDFKILIGSTILVQASSLGTQLNRYLEIFNVHRALNMQQFNKITMCHNRSYFLT